MARRTRDIWRNLIGQLERSGKSREEFATERGIPVGTLRAWVYRLRRERAEEQASILPVRVVASTAPSARQPATESGEVEVLLVRGEASAVAEVVGRLRRC